MAPLLIDHECRNLWRVALLGQAAFSSKMAHLPIVEAWNVAGGNCCGGLMVACYDGGVGARLKGCCGYCCGCCCWNCHGWNCGR
jgi:hypothetical protein